MSLLIHLALGLFSLFNRAEKRSKHAARGVARHATLTRQGAARRARSYCGQHHEGGWGGVSNVMPARQLVWDLKRERIRAARYA